MKDYRSESFISTQQNKLGRISAQFLHNRAFVDKAPY